MGILDKIYITLFHLFSLLGNLLVLKIIFSKINFLQNIIAANLRGQKLDGSTKNLFVGLRGLQNAYHTYYFG
jgi:hypothetical protein